MADGFGARLKELRRRVGLTQQALAQRAGLSVAGLARVEQGGRPKATTVVALELALGVPPGTLTGTADPGAATDESGH